MTTRCVWRYISSIPEEEELKTKINIKININRTKDIPFFPFPFLVPQKVFHLKVEPVEFVDKYLSDTPNFFFSSFHSKKLD